MIFTKLASVLALSAAVLAQYGGPPPGSSTSSAPATAPSAPPDTPGHMNIDVAFNNTFVFHPKNISAPVGTLVTFWFPGGPNSIPHSVTQSSFEQPCTYLTANSTTGTGPGFDSGLTNSVQFTINVTDDQRIWFHCKQVLHCGMGMVGSINAPSNGSNTFDAFLAAATKIGNSEVTQTTGGPVTGGVHGVATATPAATGTGSSSSSASANAVSMSAVLFFVAASFYLA
ncbi:hypothetical protein GYMLUDRAFT_44079 [Collybiopsis luxurians FD-317 M1]|uniref:Blue (type 1) copper domain-containing protein n=1 Tax=Collybiopsis luxurians FD-317 M1 TaxID=944289 RepID=A0A0D0CAY8_9AGAR|nr:hypothetical protein GYMLUDRAFT_44079 [Collybiopsis luxurians FD-317 M1]